MLQIVQKAIWAARRIRFFGTLEDRPCDWYHFYDGCLDHSITEVSASGGHDMFLKLPAFAASAVGFLVLTVTAGQATPIYEVTDLGMLAGATSSDATAINNNGQAVGFSYVTSNDSNIAYPVLFSNGAVQQLSGDSGGAFAINAAGEVVGSDNVTGNAFFLRWDSP